MIATALPRSHADLPEATRELVHRVVALDERGVELVRAVVEQAEKMGMVK